jgi:hypothetical protein
MMSKSQMIRNALATGDRLGALRIVAQFHDPSAATLSFAESAV